jgi:hypothetical protein
MESTHLPDPWELTREEPDAYRDWQYEVRNGDTLRGFQSWYEERVSGDRQQNFYLTFGVQYATEPHPMGVNVDPKGWVRIAAATEEEARAIALAHFGTHWSRLIPEEHFRPDYFPAGELTHLPIPGRSYPPLSHYSEDQP